MKMPKIVIVCGPSGCGKTTIIDKVVDVFPQFQKVKSVTSKNSRLEDYQQVSVEEFERMIAEDAFIEYTKYSGNYYGLSKESINKIQNGFIGIKAFDIVGAESLKKIYGNEAVVVFIKRDTQKMIDSINQRDVSDEEKQQRISQLAFEQLNEHNPIVDYVVEVVEDDVEKTAEIFAKKLI